MGRFDLDDALKEEIRSAVLGDGFMKLVQSVRRGGSTFRISLRPVSMSGRRVFQAESVDGGSAPQVKNLNPDDVAGALEEIISQPGARDMHVMTSGGDIHIRVTKKGHVLKSRSAPMNRDVKAMPHDRVKNTPLTSFDSSSLLKAISIADGSGAVRASMRGKYDQVNEFLKSVGEILERGTDGKPACKGRFTVVDCGCGKAYLTIALWHYLTLALGMEDVKVIGVDRRADVIESARKTVSSLDLDGKIEFTVSELSQFNVDKADMVVSLHACDTATDEALAKGVEWKAKYILSAPCCQHELNKTVKPEGVFAGLLRHSILRERLCDILTDAFRAQIMRILGFRTQVVEFVSSKATSRNVMIKCVYGVKSGQSQAVGEYLELRDWWKVTPWLETRLGAMLSKHLGKFV